jgi:hypothetical protein
MLLKVKVKNWGTRINTYRYKMIERAKRDALEHSDAG